MEKERKDSQKRYKKEKRKEEKEVKEWGERNYKFAKQVKPVIKRVAPYFVKGFRLSKKDFKMLNNYSWYGWRIPVRRSEEISMLIRGERSEPPHLLIFGCKKRDHYQSIKTKEIKMFLEDINEESIAKVIIKIEKETFKLKVKY